MEPKQPFFPKNSDTYQPLYGATTNGAPHNADAKGMIADNGKALKSQIMTRLQELEEQNDRLKSIVEQRSNENTEIIASNKKLLSVLAHDLKSPIATIYGVLGLLKDCIHEGKYHEMEEYIDIASSSSLSTTNLIENILAWSHSQSNQKQFNPIRVDIASLVGQEIANSKLAVRIKQLSLSHSIPQGFLIRADLHMAQSILRNLIGNAIKFSNPGGHIAISAEKLDPYIEIRVKDDGIGISIKDQQQLFKKGFFSQLGGNNNLKPKGLGLLLCREFIEIHGGSIRVESKPGLGSCFVFTLPQYE